MFTLKVGLYKYDAFTLMVLSMQSLFVKDYIISLAKLFFAILILSMLLLLHGNEGVYILRIKGKNMSETYDCDPKKSCKVRKGIQL